jgi:Ca2+-binding EF-hand superfamily protein
LSGLDDKLSLDGFVKGLQDNKMDCTDEEAAEIFRAVDADAKGYII